MEMLYACHERRARSRYGAKLNTPPMRAFRAPGFVEGTFGARVPAGRARGQARPRPARGPPRSTTRDSDRRRPAVLLQEPDGVLPARRAALGAPRTRCARAAKGRGSAVSAWPARSGTAAAARPPTRGCASARTAARTSSPRCRTSAPARDGDGADRRRGARPAARAGPRRARRLGPRPVRLDLGGLVDDPVHGPGGRARRPPTRRARSSRSRLSATTRSSACSR